MPRQPKLSVGQAANPYVTAKDVNENPDQYQRAYESAPTTYAGAGGKLGLGSGLLAGAIQSIRKGKGLKGSAITTLGTGALWGTGGLIGGSFIGRPEKTAATIFSSNKGWMEGKSLRAVYMTNQYRSQYKDLQEKFQGLHKNLSETQSELNSYKKRLGDAHDTIAKQTENLKTVKNTANNYRTSMKEISDELNSLKNKGFWKKNKVGIGIGAAGLLGGIGVGDYIAEHKYASANLAKLAAMRNITPPKCLTN